MKQNESLSEYCFRLAQVKDENQWTWQDIADIIYANSGYVLTSNAVKKRVRKISAPKENDLSPLERYKLADERTQISAIYRRMAREDTLKEIAHDFAQTMNSKLALPAVKPNKLQICNSNPKIGLLCISDWHYGIEIENFYNKYNTDIAKERISKLQQEVINIVKKENLTRVIILNLGDLIGGRIHLQLRINSRIDVITQTMEVAEILAEFIQGISTVVDVNYYSTLDNHSRLEPNLKDSIDLESLVRIIDWYLEERLSGNQNVIISRNTFSDDIITFKIFDYHIAGVHGHKDKPNKIIDSLSMYTHNHQDLICSAHYHHFSSEEKNETLWISNSSLMGTDDYASNLRLNAKPAQILIVASADNVCECLYKINLDTEQGRK